MATQSAAKVAPLADRVVIKPLEEAEQMRGGLYIPDTAKESRSRVLWLPLARAVTRKTSACRWT